MRPSQIRTIADVLGGEIGWIWPLLLARCLIRKRVLFGGTHWAGDGAPESQFVRRLSLAAAMYLELQKRIGEEKAFEAMRKMLVPIGSGEQWNHLQSLRVFDEKPMKRLMAFHDLMDRKGAPRFNRRMYLEQNENVCHFVITRCVFHDFFTEAGTPELAQMFCEVDREFFPAAFPEFTFHRGTSWENTIAFGNDHCEFTFERKDDGQ